MSTVNLETEHRTTLKISVQVTHMSAVIGRAILRSVLGQGRGQGIPRGNVKINRFSCMPS